MGLNVRNITNARFNQVNQLQQIEYHSTAKQNVDNSINEPSLVRNNQDNNFNNFNLTNINSNNLNTQTVNDNQVITKAYVDQGNQRSRRDVGINVYNDSNDSLKNNQDNDFDDNKITNFYSIPVNRDPSSDNELSNKKYIDDELDKKIILEFNQTLDNYLKISVGNEVYNFDGNMMKM